MIARLRNKLRSTYTRARQFFKRASNQEADQQSVNLQIENINLNRNLNRNERSNNDKDMSPGPIKDNLHNNDSNDVASPLSQLTNILNGQPTLRDFRRIAKLVSLMSEVPKRKIKKEAKEIRRSIKSSLDEMKIKRRRERTNAERINNVENIVGCIKKSLAEKEKQKPITKTKEVSKMKKKGVKADRKTDENKIVKMSKQEEGILGKNSIVSNDDDRYYSCNEQESDFLFYERDVIVADIPEKFWGYPVDPILYQDLRYKYPDEETPRIYKWIDVPDHLYDEYYSEKNVKKIHAFLDKREEEEKRKYGRYNTVEYYNDCVEKLRLTRMEKQWKRNRNVDENNKTTFMFDCMKDEDVNEYIFNTKNENSKYGYPSLFPNKRKSDDICECCKKTKINEDEGGKEEKYKNISLKYKDPKIKESVNDVEMNERSSNDIQEVVDEVKETDRKVEGYGTHAVLLGSNNTGNTNETYNWDFANIRNKGEAEYTTSSKPVQVKTLNMFGDIKSSLNTANDDQANKFKLPSQIRNIQNVSFMNQFNGKSKEATQTLYDSENDNDVLNTKENININDEKNKNTVEVSEILQNKANEDDIHKPIDFNIEADRLNESMLKILEETNMNTSLSEFTDRFSTEPVKNENNSLGVNHDAKNTESGKSSTAGDFDFKFPFEFKAVQQPLYDKQDMNTATYAKDINAMKYNDVTQPISNNTAENKAFINNTKNKGLNIENDTNNQFASMKQDKENDFTNNVHSPFIIPSQKTHLNPFAINQNLKPTIDESKFVNRFSLNKTNINNEEKPGLFEMNLIGQNLKKNTDDIPSGNPFEISSNKNNNLFSIGENLNCKNIEYTKPPVFSWNNNEKNTNNNLPGKDVETKNSNPLFNNTFPGSDSNQNDVSFNNQKNVSNGFNFAFDGLNNAQNNNILGNSNGFSINATGTANGGLELNKNSNLGSFNFSGPKNTEPNKYNNINIGNINTVSNGIPGNNSMGLYNNNNNVNNNGVGSLGFSNNTGFGSVDSNTAGDINTMRNTTGFLSGNTQPFGYNANNRASFGTNNISTQTGLASMFGGSKPANTVSWSGINNYNQQTGGFTQRYGNVSTPFNSTGNSVNTNNNGEEQQQDSRSRKRLIATVKKKTEENYTNKRDGN